MKLTYQQTWNRLRGAGFLPYQILNNLGGGGGIAAKDDDSNVFEIKCDKSGLFVQAEIEYFIAQRIEGGKMRTYRGKFEGGPQDDNAWPAFNASSLEEAINMANRKWPAEPGEKPFTIEVMQIFTNSGWAWAKDYHHD